MKNKLFSIILLGLAFATINVNAQVYTNAGNYGNKMTRVQVDSAFRVPVFANRPAIAGAPAGPGFIGWSTSAGKFYGYNGTNWNAFVDSTALAAATVTPTLNQVVNASPAVLNITKPIEFDGRLIVKGNAFPNSTTGLSFAYFPGGGGSVISQDAGAYAPLDFYGNQYNWNAGGGTAMTLDATTGLQIGATKPYIGVNSTSLRYPIFNGSTLQKITLDSLKSWMGVGGGGVNADWDATSGPARILNKPTLVTYEGNNAWTLGTRGAGTIGDYSVAAGENCVASGEAAVAMGEVSTASGEGSVAMGVGVSAPSRSEVALGNRNTTYVAADPVNPNTADRAFSVGIGTSSSNRKNAIEAWKDGRFLIPGLSTLSTPPVLTGSVRAVYADENGLISVPSSDELHGSAIKAISTGTFNVNAPFVNMNSDRISFTSPRVAPTAGYTNAIINSDGLAVNSYTSSSDNDPAYISLKKPLLQLNAPTTTIGSNALNLYTGNEYGGLNHTGMLTSTCISATGSNTVLAADGSSINFTTSDFNVGGDSKISLTPGTSEISGDKLVLTSAYSIIIRTFLPIQYANDAAADADVALPSHAEYRVTGDRAIRIKP